MTRSQQHPLTQLLTTLTLLGLLALSGCGGGGGSTGGSSSSVGSSSSSLGGSSSSVGDSSSSVSSSSSSAAVTYTITATAGENGSISPASTVINQGATTTFNVTPDTGYSIASVTGCSGSLEGDTYTTEAATADCTVEANFVLNNYTITATAGENGSISPASINLDHGTTTTFTVIPDTGYSIADVTGCEGSLEGNTYTIGAATADCTVQASFGPPTLTLTPQAIKTFYFTWGDVAGKTEYRLLEDPDGHSGYTQVASVAADTTNYTLGVSLPGRINARYMLQACNGESCIDSAPVYVSGSLVEAIGYIKASNADAWHQFGYSVALSDDGNTLAVGAPEEWGDLNDVNGDWWAALTGAVYVFTRSGDDWSQQAYIKVYNNGALGFFGHSVALSGDGNTLAVGAYGEASNATGINGDQSDSSAFLSGAVYVFTRSNNDWSQQAYIKASNTDAYDYFGWSVALSGDGDTLAVGAHEERSSATGINGDQTDNSVPGSGAVYVFTRSGYDWSQQAYIKASNTDENDHFGLSLALSGDGDTLAVGALGESSNAAGINGDQTDNSVPGSGAVYVFTRSGYDWSQQAYIKASNPGSGQNFGRSVALSGDGNTLAVGAWGVAYVFTSTGDGWSQQAYVYGSNAGWDSFFGASVSLSGDGNTLAVTAPSDDSSATGINDDQSDNSAFGSGAAYVYTRSGDDWSQQAYIKASNTDAYDYFGSSVALSDDGDTLAVGAYGESSNASGIDGDQSDNSVEWAGAVYLY